MKSNGIYQNGQGAGYPSSGQKAQEVKDILSARPGFVVRWGVILVLGFILMVLFIAGRISYSDEEITPVKLLISSEGIGTTKELKVYFPEKAALKLQNGKEIELRFNALLKDQPERLACRVGSLDGSVESGYRLVTLRCSNPMTGSLVSFQGNIPLPAVAQYQLAPKTVLSRIFSFIGW